MKKLCIAMGALLISASMYGQVGINTDLPKATLDVVGKTIDGTLPEGIIAPRLTGDALFAAASGTASQYGAAQDGAIVYITAAVSPGNDIGQTVHLTAPGYYYFDAVSNVWKGIGDDSTIYSTDGTLSSPRIMDMNSSTLGFTNGRVAVGTNASDPASILELQSTTRGFLPPRMTRAQVDAIAFPPPGLVVYCTDFLGAGKGCLMVNDSIDPSVPQWGSMCSSNATTPVVLILDCASTVTTGSLFSGQPASGVSSSVPYSGGNGGAYQAASFSSTGVTGLVANLPGGILNTGNGNLVFNITGTPAASGIATFTITVAGQSCSFTVPVTASTATVGSLTCGSAVFSPTTLTQGSVYSGTLSIPYTGGNGAAYPQQSQTVNGLTFTLPAGTLNTGSGSLVYTVTGTPSSAGAMSVPISFGGQSCNVTATVASGLTVVLPGNPQAWMRHNLGANTSLDPDQDPSVIGLHGNYYQWGRPAVVANASTPAGAIGGWNTTDAPNNSWQDAAKTANDPCPAGFRVPTSQQFTNLINSNTASNIGTFTDSPTNYTAAKVFTGGGNKLTLPAAGYRYDTTGTLFNRGSNGLYWSSTQNAPTTAYSLVFGSTTVGVSNLPYRTRGFSIRCISQ